MPRPARRHTPTHVDGRPVKITFGEMREMGLRGVLVYCHCGHHIALSADRWPDDVRLSGIEPRFICAGCGRRGAEVRPDFESGMPPQFASSNARETAAKRPYFACELMKRELSAIGYIAGLAAYRVPRA